MPKCCGGCHYFIKASDHYKGWCGFDMHGIIDPDDPACACWRTNDRHIYYSFLAEKFDWVRFISDFYEDDLKWAVIEKPTEIIFVTRDLDLYNKIRQRLDTDITGFSGALYSYRQLEIDGREIIFWDYTKDKLHPLLKILRAKNKKRFSVHCGYEND